MSAAGAGSPVEELSLDDPTPPPPGPAGPGPGRRSPLSRRRAAVAGGAVAALLFAAWSGHAAGASQGRDAGRRAALEQARVLVWSVGDAVPDGAGRARLQLFAASGSGRPLTVRRLHVGADTVTPVQPLEVPEATSASTTAVAQVACGSARELELMRSAPGADRVGTLTADVVDGSGTEREAPLAPLPDEASFRALLRLAACPASADGTGTAGAAAAGTSGLSIVAMTAQSNGSLTILLEAGPEASAARVGVVRLGTDGPFTVTAEPASGVTVEPGGPRAQLLVRLAATGCPGLLGGQPSVEGLLALEVRTPGLVSRARLPGWDQGAVGQAAAVALRNGCEG
ncbi:hypothetical protein [Kineosporia sp. R_H_3]|uniref:hypothetical protein n=1 Tax=Kineosporia sp. R_H_3 TaxID=1961848 RepID=UPI00117BD8A9|nr:hypothetical protein [Kineosporia sp. R_H_3]